MGGWRFSGEYNLLDPALLIPYGEGLDCCDVLDFLFVDALEVVLALVKFFFDDRIKVAVDCYVGWGQVAVVDFVPVHPHVPWDFVNLFEQALGPFGSCLLRVVCFSKVVTLVSNKLFRYSAVEELFPPYSVLFFDGSTKFAIVRWWNAGVFVTFTPLGEAGNDGFLELGLCFVVFQPVVDFIKALFPLGGGRWRWAREHVGGGLYGV